MSQLKGKILCVFLALLVLPAVTAGALTENEYDYILDRDNADIRVPIPKAYVMTASYLNFGEEVGTLGDVQDLFVDDEDNLYIVDSSNSRIIKCGRDGQVLRVFTGEGEAAMNKPEGMFVYSDGDIFVADTGNERILHISPEGEFVEEFVKPESELLESNFIYNPRKVVITNTGYIYSIKYQLLMQMDSSNEFRGYVGSTRVPFDITRFLVNLFGSEQQKSKLQKAMPAAYTNFVLGKDGLFYATTLDYTDGQIKKLTTTGSNIYPVQDFGEQVLNKAGWLEKPVFEDIAVDKNGIITVCERLSARLFQYDQEGNLLAVWGGKGSNRDQLSQPRCIEVDSTGRIYVYDNGRNEICVYEPTAFMELVHEAVTSYTVGAYDEALENWTQVLGMSETYSLAQIGVGKTHFKRQEYEEAMEAFQIANDKEQYSRAYDKYRYAVLQTRFPLILCAAVLLAAALFVGIHFLRKLSDSLERRFLRNRGRM